MYEYFYLIVALSVLLSAFIALLVSVYFISLLQDANPIIKHKRENLERTAPEDVYITFILLVTPYSFAGFIQQQASLLVLCTQLSAAAVVSVFLHLFNPVAIL
ncbi:MAG: hypothetical protein JWR61_1374 [Ferruginibacter sp.]|uniref:hypothetical protein n=1 Tax=Ferruginibacter sp. TaxID=1940288 RepID=UPI002659BAC9|nr:hypothetical protein [Ferruginibacter sp.]MDB5276419.1 hypothetical protein [Ferruginibacter sp.]